MKLTDKEQLLLDRERLEYLRDEHQERVVKERIRKLENLFDRDSN